MSSIKSTCLQALRASRAATELSDSAPLCVALSGGADSVALLCLLADDPAVSAIHVHHGIRGAEADRDAEFCRTLCRERSVPLTVLHINAPALAKERGVGLETAARDGRYEAITAHLKENGIPLLVTAHHADDQLETVLLHLLRGSGLNGLGGIPACRPLDDGIFVARPLLSVTHAELTAYLQEIGQSFVEDSTNVELCCNRNRLRLEISPLLEEISPGCAHTVSRAAETLREDEAYFADMAEAFIQKEGCEPSLAALASLPRPIFARVVRRLLPQCPERAHVTALYDFCQKAAPHATLSLPGIAVAAESGRLCVHNGQADAADYEIPLQRGVNPLPGGGEVLLLSSGEALVPSSPSHHSFIVQIPLCSDKIKGVLRARNLRPGDRIRSLGVNRTVRRLAGADVPLSTRATMPLLVDDDGVVACPFGKNCNVRDDVYDKDACDTVAVLLFN